MDTLLLAIALATASAESPEGPAEEAHEMNQNLTDVLAHLRSIPTPDGAPTTLESMETEDPPDGDPLIVSAQQEGEYSTPVPDPDPIQDTSTDTDSE
jgi:hypothetical protein|tara:strand:+ start:2106 stop:2396 length:291 start_codon:yes stop_codon:yes gene_type:complete